MARRTKRKKKTTRKTRRIRGSVPSMKGGASLLMGAAENEGMSNAKGGASLLMGVAHNEEIWTAKDSREVGRLYEDLLATDLKWEKATDEETQETIRRHEKDLQLFNKEVANQEKRLAKLNKDNSTLESKLRDLEKKAQTDREIIKTRSGRISTPSEKQKESLKDSNEIQDLELRLQSIQGTIHASKLQLEHKKREILETAGKLEDLKTLIKEHNPPENDKSVEIYAFLLNGARGLYRKKHKIPDTGKIYDSTKPQLTQMVKMSSGFVHEAVPRKYDVESGILMVEAPLTLNSSKHESSEGNPPSKVPRGAPMKQVKNPHLFLEGALGKLNKYDPNPFREFLLGYSDAIKSKDPRANGGTNGGMNGRANGGTNGGANGGTNGGANGGTNMNGGYDNGVPCTYQGGYELGKTSKKQGIDPLQLNTMEDRLTLSNENLATVEKRYEEFAIQVYEKAQEGPQSKKGDRPYPVIYQMLTMDDMMKAFSTEGMRQKWKKGKIPIGENHIGREMEQGYKKKMETEANTRSNANKLVSMFCAVSPMAEPLLFTEGLIRTMRHLNIALNGTFQRNFFYRGVTGHPGTKIVHTGGNLIGVLSGMIISLVLPDGDPDSYIEKIKNRFRESPNYPIFMDDLKEEIRKDPSFLVSLIEGTNKTSDFDACVMTDDDDILTLDSGFIRAANLACAKSLRDLLVSEERVAREAREARKAREARETGKAREERLERLAALERGEKLARQSKEVIEARIAREAKVERLESGERLASGEGLASEEGIEEFFLPFPPHEPYTGKTFSSFSQLSTEDFHDISRRGTVEQKQRGSQTSNRLDILKVIVNRLKIGTKGGKGLGEYVDLVICSLENPTFREKLLRFLMGDISTLEMLIDELEVILAKGEDDKSPIRRKRLALLKTIKKIRGANDLFRITGRVLSNEDIEEYLQWEGTYDPEFDD